MPAVSEAVYNTTVVYLHLFQDARVAKLIDRYYFGMRSVGCYAKNWLHKLLPLYGSVPVSSSSPLLLFSSSPPLLLSYSPILLFNLSLLFLFLFLFQFSLFFFSVVFFYLFCSLLFSSVLFCSLLFSSVLFCSLLFSSVLFTHFSSASLSCFHLAYQTFVEPPLYGRRATGNWPCRDHPPILTFVGAPQSKMFLEIYWCIISY